MSESLLDLSKSTLDVPHAVAIHVKQLGNRQILLPHPHSVQLFDSIEKAKADLSLHQALECFGIYFDNEENALWEMR